MKKKLLGAAALVMALLMLLCGCGEDEAVSDSDAAQTEPTAVWEELPDDEAYMQAMREKMDEYISLMTELSAMEKSLSALGSAEKIIAHEGFAAANEALSDWCEGAYSYPVGTLEGAQAQDICRQLCELAGATADYLELLPLMLSGSYTGVLPMSDYQNSIADSAIAVYEALTE